jgi:heme/copper-type cytochrome/quinol oxidase subunit 2
MQIFQNSLNYEENFRAKGSLFPQFGFSNCATFRMQEIIALHNTIMYFLVLILTVVIYLLYIIITTFRYDSYHI